MVGATSVVLHTGPDSSQIETDGGETPAVIIKKKMKLVVSLMCGVLGVCFTKRRHAWEANYIRKIKIVG